MATLVLLTEGDGQLVVDALYFDGAPSQAQCVALVRARGAHVGIRFSSRRVGMPEIQHAVMTAAGVVSLPGSDLVLDARDEEFDA